MTIEISRSELRKLMSNETSLITRYFPSGCVLKEGDTVNLVSRPSPEAPQVNVAKATVRSVRPMTVNERRAQTKEALVQAQQEGWRTVPEWWGHFERKYPQVWTGEEILHRLHLIIEWRDQNAPDSRM